MIAISATTSNTTPIISDGYETAATTVTITAMNGSARSIGVAWWTARWQAYAAMAAVRSQRSCVTGLP
jgi:hypothetical protein